MVNVSLRTIALGPLLLACLVLGIGACSSGDDTEAIRRLIEKGAGLAEEKKVGDLLKLTTGDFSADPGGMDVRTVKRILFGAFMHYGQFKLHYPKPAVELDVDGVNSSATVYFLIVRQDQAVPGLKALKDDPRQWLETVGEKADLYQLSLSMVKAGDDWAVQRAVLEGFKGTHF